MYGLRPDSAQNAHRKRHPLAISIRTTPRAPPLFIAKALGNIARAKGMAQVARDAGLSRESLYKALSGERSPGFDTILKVVSALGLKLHAEAKADG